MYTTQVQILTHLYLQLAILIAREAGQLPAWEGIRIVYTAAN